MASAHILVTSGSQHSAQLRDFVDELYQVQDKARRLKATYDQAALGGDWTALAALIGVSDEDAQAVYNLLGSVSTELQATFITQMLGRLG